LSSPQREIIRTARKNTVSERKKQAQHHQAQRSGQGGRLQPTAAAEEESSATSVSEADDETALRAPARIRKSITLKATPVTQPGQLLP